MLLAQQRYRLEALNTQTQLRVPRSAGTPLHLIGDVQWTRDYTPRL